MSYAPRIAIVGGGLTGAAAAIELLRSIGQSFDMSIIEPEDQLGRGIAYGKAEAFHLLNVRAGRLGIIHDQPGDFALWARGQSFGIRPPRQDQPEPTRSFLPRRLFGAYVEDRLQREAAGRPDINFEHVRSIATGVRRCPGGYEITFQNQSPLIAQFVILATGYGRPAPQNPLGKIPFSDLDTDKVRTARSALFVGTGLTFVDEFLRLRSRGFRGEALAISRHGLLPEVHRANEAPRKIGLAAGHPDLGRLSIAFRRAMKDGELPALEAVNVVLGERDQAQALWRSLGIKQQRRFLRHLRPYWNAVRHRLAPEIHAQLRQSMQNGAVRIAAGRVLDANSEDFRIRMRGEGPLTRRFDLVFDCTGFRPDTKSPLVMSLVRQGLARIDAHCLGLSVAPAGALLTRGAARSPGLFALGPLGHGSLYEITAVPEIVAQAAAMAKSLRAEIGRVRSTDGASPEHRGMRTRRVA